MSEFIARMIEKHFVMLFGAAMTAAVVGFLVLAYLFKLFFQSKESAENARRAVELEFSILGRLGRLLRRKSDVVVPVQVVVDPLAPNHPAKYTLSEPIAAVPDPRRSGEHP